MSRFDRLNRAVLRHHGEEDGTVTIIRDGEADLDVAAVYDKRHFEGGFDGRGLTASTVETTVSVMDSDTGAVAQGDQVRVGAVTYTVTDTRPDATGWTVLVLGAAS